MENFTGLQRGTRNLTAALMSPYAPASPVSPKLAGYVASVQAYALAWDEFLLQDECTSIRDIGHSHSGSVLFQVAENTASCKAQARSLQDMGFPPGKQIAAADPVLALVMDNPAFQSFGDPVQSTRYCHYKDYLQVVLASSSQKASQKAIQKAIQEAPRIVKFQDMPDGQVLAALAPAWHTVW
jgi:hypothetical protein